MPRDDNSGPPPRRPRGRPKGKPLSDAERAQRRGAAWKHGGRAATTLRQVVHPCRKDLCPMSEANGGDGFPCEVKRQVDNAGGALEACVPEMLSRPELQERFRAALATGDLSDLSDITARALAGMTTLHSRELELLLQDGGGLAIEQEMVDKEGNIVGSRLVVNPAIEPLLKLNAQLGFTAPDQRLTPKSQGEGKRDEGVNALIEFMTDRRRTLEEPQR